MYMIYSLLINYFTMALLQIEVDDKLKKAIQKKAETYGITTSAIIRIVLVRSFTKPEEESLKAGNVFNANRDNNGKALNMDYLINTL